MLLVSAVMRSTFTPGPSSISYCVTVGPREKPVTVASTLNCSKTPVMAATTASFASDRDLWGVPWASAVTDGRRYGALGWSRGASPPMPDRPGRSSFDSLSASSRSDVCEPDADSPASDTGSMTSVTASSAGRGIVVGSGAGGWIAFSKPPSGAPGASSSVRSWDPSSPSASFSRPLLFRRHQGTPSSEPSPSAASPSSVNRGDAASVRSAPNIHA